jgi:propanol-preferring alcohol dehydrogenase
MRAVEISTPGAPEVLKPVERPDPVPAPGEVLIRVAAAGVNRPDVLQRKGAYPAPPGASDLPGLEVAGTIESLSVGVKDWRVGDRVCALLAGGGYAEYAVADERFCFPIPDGFEDLQAAPLLCAGLIGYRSLRFAGDAERLGVYGFGASAHIVAQVAHYQGRQVFAFTRPGDRAAQDFAHSLGAVWAGGSDEMPPEPLDAALIFAPVGALVPAALAATRKGGTVVCGGIHMSDIPSFPYRLLWEERVVRSVANLTRRDAEEFLALAPKAGVTTATVTYPLAEANQALTDLRNGVLQGAAVLVP